MYNNNYINIYYSYYLITILFSIFYRKQASICSPFPDTYSVTHTLTPSQNGIVEPVTNQGCQGNRQQRANAFSALSI